MNTLMKAIVSAMIVAAACAAPASAQNYYRTLDTSGCVIDVGRTAAPNSAYAYTYTLRNQCNDRTFTVYYEVNGRSRSALIGRNSEWGYPVLNGEHFELTAIEG